MPISSFFSHFRQVCLKSFVGILGILSPIQRFKLIRFGAKWLQWPGRVLGFYKLNHFYLDGYRSTALAVGFRLMYRRGIGFDIPGRMIGIGALPDSGAILISGHFHLNYAFLRNANDLGYPVCVVRAGNQVFPSLLGSRAPLEQIVADQHMFTKVRRMVTAGYLVMIMIDHDKRIENSEKWWPFDTVQGGKSFSKSTIRLARKIGAPIFFTASFLNSSYTLEMHVDEPESSDVEGICGEFERFLRNKIGDVA